MQAETHIAVLKGGWSPEREISLVSGAACARALATLGYRVSEVDVGRDIAARLAELRPDLCFNALHGVGGEDGEIQGLLEVMEIPYTHSGVCASALAMDKYRAKRLFAAAGLPVAADMLLEKDDADGTHPMPPPYVAKPVNQGSSVGVEIVPEGANTPPACITAEGWAFEGSALVEDYIAGRELTCCVIGDSALDVMEIIPAAGFYDWQAKYAEGGSRHDVPADIPDALAEEARRYSETAHRVLGCRGATRTDFRYDPDGGLVVLEVNTQPGMTPVSLVPEMAARRGMDFNALVKWMVEDASCRR